MTKYVMSHLPRPTQVKEHGQNVQPLQQLLNKTPPNTERYGWFSNTQGYEGCLQLPSWLSLSYDKRLGCLFIAISNKFSINDSDCMILLPLTTQRPSNDPSPNRGPNRTPAPPLPIDQQRLPAF
jgi:hypothetical protein